MYECAGVCVCVCVCGREGGKVCVCVCVCFLLSLSFHKIAQNCAFDTIKLKCLRHYIPNPKVHKVFAFSPLHHPLHQLIIENWFVQRTQNETWNIKNILLIIRVSHVGGGSILCPGQPTTTNLLLPINLSRKIFSTHRTLTYSLPFSIAYSAPCPSISISCRRLHNKNNANLIKNKRNCC